jgi:hypothetical protein
MKYNVNFLSKNQKHCPFFKAAEELGSLSSVRSHRVASTDEYSSIEFKTCLAYA